MNRIFLLVVLIFIFKLVSAQSIVINDDGASGDDSAILELQSSDKGFLAPRMTTSQRISISTPATGLLVYDTDLSGYFQFDGTVWNAYHQTATGTNSGDVPTNPNEGDKYYEVNDGKLFIYTSAGWSEIVTGTAMETPYGDKLDITFGTVTGNSITISSFEVDAAYVGYVVIINSENTFSDLVNGEAVYESTTYASNGEQVVYDGSSSGSFSVTLLMDQSTYYFKIVPYTSGRVYVNDEPTQKLQLQQVAPLTVKQILRFV